MIKVRRILNAGAWIGALAVLPSCTGIFDSVYDDAPEEKTVTQAGQLYIDASDWSKWHYIDMKEVTDATASVANFNPSSLWRTFGIPMAETRNPGSASGRPGIYTYWYDVFGEGISNNEYRDFYPTDSQTEPDNWTFAVHRNNVRTNSCSVARTDYHSFDELPDGTAWTDNLFFEGDSWNEKDVWTIQDRMLLGLIGNQGIEINNTFSTWLTISIPPMPPAFTHSDNIFILRLSDRTLAAVQLEDYQSATGTKCCLTINYMYPL